MTIVRGITAACMLALCMACGRDGDEVPPLETQTVTPPQAQATPEKVTGCLRAGEAEGTYVVTASRLDTSMPAATYELVGSNERFGDHIGHKVEVTGTVVSEQAATSRGATLPAEDRAKGTTGTPTVQSTTKVEFKRLQVTNFAMLDDDCEEFGGNR